MIRHLAFVIGLLLACSNSAWAAPAYVQRGVAGTMGTGAPANGNIVTWLVPNTAAVGSVTVKDSNGASLAEHQPSGNCVAENALCVGIFDYVVSGSPTATYTITGVTASDTYCVGAAYAMEISGAAYGSAVYTTTNVATYSAPLVNTIATVAINDFQATNMFCNAGYGALTITFSNGSKVTAGSGNYALATSTASSTATAAFPFAGTSIVNVYVDYPAIVAVPSKGGVFPYPGLFNPAFLRGDWIFEMLAKA